MSVYGGAGCDSDFRLQWPYQIHPHGQRTDSHNRSLCKSALQTGHDLIHIGFPRGSCENRFAPVFPDPSSDQHLLPTSPRPVRSCPHFQNLQPVATPCLLLAVRTCTTSLHTETCSCC